MSHVPQPIALQIRGENMRTRYIALASFILLMATFINAQPGKKPATTRPAGTTAGSNQAASDFEFEVSITPLGLAGIIVRKKTGLGLFTPAMLSSFASQSAKNSLSPSFVIRPDKSVKMVDILAAINAIRVSPKTDIKMEVDADLSVFIPKKPDPNAFPRPNPLFLIVTIDEKSNISLNGEKQGVFPDTSKVEQHLKQIFQDREKNGLAETTVVVNLAKNMTFANLVELARAVKRAGSQAIGLQVDETDKMLEVDISKP